MKNMYIILFLFVLIGISSKMEAQGNQMVYESLYVQTDRDVYNPADTIYLCGYLFDLQKERLADYSRAIYVELLDSDGNIKSRVKVGFDSLCGKFPGYIPLKPTLSNGTYQLRGFTHWMQNQGEASFFVKDIVIDNRHKNPNSSGDKQVVISASDLGEFDFANLTISVLEKGMILEGSKDIGTYVLENAQRVNKGIVDNATPSYYMERSTVLSGYVVNRKGKIEANAKIAFIGEDNRAYYAYSDGNGYIECPVEWDNTTRFYSRKEGDFGFHDVMLKQDEQDLICDVHDSPSNNPYAWTDKEVVLDVYEYPMSGAPSSVRMPMGSADALGSAGEASRYRAERNTPAVYKSFTASSDNAPTNVVVKKKRKFNIQRVVNGVQRQDVEFVYSGGATRYWNPNAVVKGGESFEFSFPASADVDSYVVVVNGVDDKGNPVSGVYKLEGER